MGEIATCTWAPTALAVPRLTKGREWADKLIADERHGDALAEHLLSPVRLAESLGIDYLLVAQRWWGTGEDIEGSSYDCVAMTAFYAAHTRRIRLITAIHPGFFLPAPIAKWGATLDRLTGGRWAINLTSGWHEAEFGMYGAELLPHDERYARTTEFIEILRGTWRQSEFSYNGRYYRVQGLRVEPRPVTQHLEVFQGGQSPAAMDMAAQFSDWMFLNGGPPEKIARIISEVRRRTAQTGHHVRFGLYAIPLCRPTDAQAESHVAAMVDALDDSVLERRRTRTAGAQGMWTSSEDKLTQLDTNEGFASRLIGSPDTILRRMQEFHHLGIDLFHLTLHDSLFNKEVLPLVKTLGQ
ncbi:MAG: LLM class flavin-dependent oxidoreductase [Candidatus Binatia bacterium]